MKVLHINCNYIGTALHQTMIRNLTQLGIVNQVYVATYNKDNAVIEADPNVIISECFQKWDRVFFDYKQSKILKDIQSRTDIRSYDCIHAYTLFTDGNSARKLSKKFGIPYVVAVRNTDVNDFFRFMIHLRGRGVQIMRDASAVFFLSEAYRKQVFEQYIPKKFWEEIGSKTKIIPNGIDDFWLENPPAALKKQPEKSDAIRLIYAGRINKNKNISAIQKAMKILKGKKVNCVLTVVGQADDQAELGKIRNDPDTRYISAKPKEELIRLYRENHIFIMPSFKETFGLVYAEAISQDLPVVYTKGQGFDGQFPEGQVGYSVDASDPAGLAEAIQKIWDDYSSFRNIHCFAEKFHWEQIAVQYNGCYKNIEASHNTHQQVMK